MFIKITKYRSKNYYIDRALKILDNKYGCANFNSNMFREYFINGTPKNPHGPIVIWADGFKIFEMVKK